MTRRGGTDPQTVLDKAKAGFEGGIAAWIEGQTFLEVWLALWASLDEWAGDYTLTETSESFRFLRRYPHKMSHAQLEAQIARDCPSGGFFAVRFMRATGEKLKPIGQTYLFQVQAAPDDEEDDEEMSKKDLDALVAQNAKLQEAIDKLREDARAAKQSGDSANASAFSVQIDTLITYQKDLQKELADLRDQERTRWRDVENARKDEYRETQETAKEIFKHAGDAIKESVAEMSNTTRFLFERLQSNQPQPQQSNGGGSMAEVMQFFMAQQNDTMRSFQSIIEKMDERQNTRLEKMEGVIKDIMIRTYQPNPATPPNAGLAGIPAPQPVAPLDPVEVTLATLRKNKELAEMMGYSKAADLVVEDKKSGLSEITEMLDKLGIKDIIHAKMTEKPENVGSRARPPKMGGVNPPAAATPPQSAIPRYEIPSFAPPQPQQPPQPPQQTYYPPPQPQQPPQYAPISPSAFVQPQPPQQPPQAPGQYPINGAYAPGQTPYPHQPPQAPQPPQQPPQSPYIPPQPPQQPPQAPQQPYYPQPQPPQPGQNTNQSAPELQVVQLPDGSWAPAHLAAAPKIEPIDSGDPDEASGATAAIHILPELEAYAGHLKPLLTQIFYAAPNAPDPKKLIKSLNPDPTFRTLLAQFPEKEIAGKIAEMINDPVVRDPSRSKWLSSVVREYMNP